MAPTSTSQTTQSAWQQWSVPYHGDSQDYHALLDAVGSRRRSSTPWQHGSPGSSVRNVTSSPMRHISSGRRSSPVPEEAGDVAAVLPAELRELWNTAVPG